MGLAWIDETTRIGPGCRLGHNAVLLADVTLGQDVYVGHNTVIHPGTRIGAGARIEDNCTIGRQPRSSFRSTRKVETVGPLVLSPGVIVGCSVVLYAGSTIGPHSMIGDLASIREQCEIGEEVIIGRNVMVELKARIGARTVIQTACHITGDIVIEDEVFFGAEVVTMNDKYMSRRPGVGYSGPVVRRGASVGCNATLLPGVVIGEGAMIGAGAVVTKNIPPFGVAVGVPAVVIKSLPRPDGGER